MNQRSARLRDLALGFFGLAVLAVLAVGCLYLVWRGFTGLDPVPAAAIATASGTVLLSVLSLIVSKRWEHKRDLELQLRDRKLPIYEEFMRFWFRALMHGQTGESEPSEQEMAVFLSDFTQKLILWGSDGVLRQYSEFRLYNVRRVEEQREDEMDPSLLVRFENIMLEIRADLGHRNKNLETGTLLGLFVNDAPWLADTTEPDR